KPHSAAPAVDAPLPFQRRAEVTADCYTLLLVLASVRGQQPLSGQRAKERYQEALQLLDGARKLGFQTRAYHLRRAHFLERLGGEEGGRQNTGQGAFLS